MILRITSRQMLHCIVLLNAGIQPLTLIFHLVLLCGQSRYYTFTASEYWSALNWIEQGLTSPPTQYRLSRRQFYRSKDPTNSIKVLKHSMQ